jgi:multidrug transporter EmrE-like cation transporter
MIPLQFYVFGEPPADWRSLDWSSVINVGHLWYIEHLLLFSLCYALGRTFWKGRGPVAEAERKSPGYLAVLAFALALAVASAVIRIWYPIDRWVNLLGFMRVALADVPRDLSFFIIGAVAYRHDWFLRFPTGAGRVWLGVGVVAAASWYAYALGLRQVFPVSGMAMGVVYPIWEALLCCGMCIGLLVLFREKVDLQGRLLSAMARNQYAAYVVHVSVLILIQYAVAGIHWPPLVKFALVVLVGVPLTFLFSDWIRQPAFMRKVL